MTDTEIIGLIVFVLIVAPLIYFTFKYGSYDGYCGGEHDEY